MIPPEEQWDSIVISIAMNKVDAKTIDEWESRLNANFSNDSVMIVMIGFLKNIQEILESRNSVKSVNQRERSSETKSRKGLHVG